jgi:hypothetical protein
VAQQRNKKGGHHAPHQRRQLLGRVRKNETQTDRHRLFGRYDIMVRRITYVAIDSLCRIWYFERISSRMVAPQARHDHAQFQEHEPLRYDSADADRRSSRAKLNLPIITRGANSSLFISIRFHKPHSANKIITPNHCLLPRITTFPSFCPLDLNYFRYQRYNDFRKSSKLWRQFPNMLGSIRIIVRSVVLPVQRCLDVQVRCTKFLW